MQDWDALKNNGGGRYSRTARMDGATCPGWGGGMPSCPGRSGDSARGQRRVAVHVHAWHCMPLTAGSRWQSAPGAGDAHLQTRREGGWVRLE